MIVLASHLLRMFVNMANGQRGLVCQYDVVCFDEVSGISFDQKDGVNIMKGYMASGQFSRSRENIRADGGIVMLGNLDVDIQQQQRIGHLLSPLPPEMRNDTAFMDRIHAFVPGWDFPKVKMGEHMTDHFGLVSDFLSECWNKLRQGSRVNVMQGRVYLGGALSGRDIEAVNKTVSGLLKLLYPDPATPVGDEELESIVRLALEARRRVKEQKKRVFKSEFRNTHFSYTMGADGVEQFVSVSIASVSERNFMPRCFKSSSMVIKSRKLRPSRSSFQTMSVSPCSSFFKQRSRAGRLVVAPDRPSSLNTVLHPAFFNAASCSAGFWSSVETRA
jgi:predicted ATP-dependent Lon-type protease